MNDEELIGYLFDLLDPDDRAAAAAHVAANPDAAARLDRLRATLPPLAADREPDPAPPQLAVRTVARLAAYLVEHHPRGPAAPTLDNVKVLTAPVGGNGTHTAEPLALRRATSTDAPDPQSVGWRFRADLVVAAGIALVALGLVFSGVSRARHEQAVLACQNNLRQLHHGLAGYADDHDGRFPQIGVPPYPTAGAFVAALSDAGQFPDGFTPVCPAAARDNQLNVGYTYTLGHIAPGGGVLGLRRPDRPDQENDLLPIAADCPAAGLVPGTGPVCAHRNTMSVLFVGGNVRSTTVPTVGPNGDDIYRNRFGQVSAGLDRTDAVLGRADDRP